jgi:hypothetical protein
VGRPFPPEARTGSPPGAGPPPFRVALGTHSDSAQRFGEYLVQTGCLTPVQLRAAIAYHRSRRIRIGAAAAALGFISQPKLDWAAQAFHARRH